MYFRVKSVATFGINGYLVDVETHIANGLPRFKIVGLPDKAVEEAKERVTAAIKSSGFTFPLKRITVSLAPANIPKQGPMFDLPIAICILLASKQVSLDPSFDLQKVVLGGELGLDGEVKNTPGTPLIVQTAIENKISITIIPPQQRCEPSFQRKTKIIEPKTLTEIVDIISGRRKPRKKRKKNVNRQSAEAKLKISDIRGNSTAKRALLIAAAGRHHISLIGPPGCGKTMLSQTITGIMPQLSDAERFEVEKIYSISGDKTPPERPFRHPHHTASYSAIIGGGNIPSPGEISLAHTGVLFLDEFSEFSKNVINAMRQPLETSIIQISRKYGRFIFPCDFVLATAMNPCPCGYLGNSTRKCTCRPTQILSHRNKISGAIWDRMDLSLYLEQCSFGELVNSTGTGEQHTFERTVKEVWEREKRRSKFNCKINLGEVKTLCRMTSLAEKLLKDSFEKLNLSTRGMLQTTRVAKTISDIENCETITDDHIAEAIFYRQRI